MTPERFRKLKSVLQLRQLDLTVLMEHVHKPHNLSAIMRTCDAVGVQNIHAVTKDEHVRATKSAASGSGKWLDIQSHSDINTAMSSLKNQGMQILAAHPSDHCIDFREMDYTKPSVILLGTELYGVSDEALEQADQHIIIPMLGTVDSLNVSVAAALILFEAQRQRLIAGLYDKQQLSDEAFHQILFKWSHPKLARFYESKALPFPELDEDGQVIEAEHHIKARLNN